MSDFGTTARTFDRYRALPPGVPAAIRSVVWSLMNATARAYVLDLGAGTGRIGNAFVETGDAYVGVDLSLEMLREFAAQARALEGRVPCLAQADGERLPFRDATFDVVLVIHVLSGARRWRGLLDEARRVVRAGGMLVVGRTVAPRTGIDAQLKSRLAMILEEMGVEAHDPRKRLDDALCWLQSVTRSKVSVVAASWTVNRTPHEFMVRHRTGARFAALPASTQEEGLRQLSAWAEETYGSLDATSLETHAFLLDIFRSH